MDDDKHYTLYIFPFSLYSIMVRFTIALGRTYQRGTPPKAPPKVSLKLLDLHRDENLTEEFLQINPKGQVPVLTAEGCEVLTESLDISYFFCRKYFPNMLPQAHQVEIQELLSKLHAIQGFSLSVKEEKMKEEWAVEILDPGLEELLARDDLSDEYSRALRFKKKFRGQGVGIALRPESVAKAKAQANELFERLVALRKLHNSNAGDEELWLFGSSTGPTILDAHAAAYIARLLDAGNEALVPEELVAFAQKITGLPAWKDVSKGRSTIWNIGYGHVGSLGPHEI